MNTIRQRLSIFIFCSTVLAACALAQSPLTQIQDTVYTPDGALFDGTVVITWLGSISPTGSSPAPYNTSVKIYNGALSVSLVPSTTATPPANYQAVYNSSDGLVTWTEFWQVPPSSTPLALNEVRVSNGGATTGGSGASGSIAIAQVTGLSSTLSALNSSIASLTALVNTLNSTVTNLQNSIANLTAQVNALFEDDDIPQGTIDGHNLTFTLSATPNPPLSLKLFKNGVLLQQNTDYTLNGLTITFISQTVTPQPGDALSAYYRIANAPSPSIFVNRGAAARVRHDR